LNCPFIETISDLYCAKCGNSPLGFLTVSTTVLLLAEVLAVRVTVVVAETGFVVTTTSTASVPAGTVTVAGSVAALRLLLVSVTTNPLGPARPVSLIDIVLKKPPFTDVGFNVTVDTAGA
jgi:hypothetical protein